MSRAQPAENLLRDEPRLVEGAGYIDTQEVFESRQLFRHGRGDSRSDNRWGGASAILAHRTRRRGDLPEDDGKKGGGTDVNGGRTNGYLMRLAPVPMAYAADPELAIRTSGVSAQVTHGSRVAYDCCRYLGALIVGCLGEPRRLTCSSANGLTTRRAAPGTGATGTAPCAAPSRR
jgi:ADP-ribosylglycohydrolase